MTKFPGSCKGVHLLKGHINISNMKYYYYYHQKKLQKAAISFHVKDKSEWERMITLPVPYEKTTFWLKLFHFTNLQNTINWNTLFQQNRGIKHCDKLEKQIWLCLK